MNDRDITKTELQKFIESEKWQQLKKELDQNRPELLIMLTKCASCAEIFPILVVDNHETACMNQLYLWKYYYIWHLYGTHCTTHTFQCYPCTDRHADYPFYTEDELKDGKCPECESDDIHDVDERCDDWIVTHKNDKYIVWNGHNYKPSEKVLEDIKRLG